MRAMLADNQPRVRSALRLLLEQEPDNAVVAEVDNGGDMLTAAAAAQPDVVLMDWELPGDSPVRVLPALRAACQNLCVVVLSGRPEARQKALAAGADFFVSKGNSPDELLSALAECLRARSSNQANGKRPQDNDALRAI